MFPLPALPVALTGPAAKLLLVLGLVLTAGVGGFFFGKDFEQGNNAEEERVEQEAYIEEIKRQSEVDRAVASEVAGDLDDERHARRQDRIAFERKLADVSRGTLTEIANENKGEGAAATVGRPAVRLSAIACGLWNDALAQSLTAAERAGWTAGEDPCTGAVEVEAALANLSQVAALLGQCRAREQETLVFFERVGLTRTR